MVVAKAFSRYKQRSQAMTVTRCYHDNAAKHSARLGKNSDVGGVGLRMNEELFGVRFGDQTMTPKLDARWCPFPVAGDLHQ